MTQIIAAKPTLCRGVRMKSRLEARWGNFLHLAGAEWIYESEELDIDGEVYTPDFLISGDLFYTYVEIKPSMDMALESKALRCLDTLNTDGLTTMLIVGRPWPGQYDVWLGLLPYVVVRADFSLCTECGKLVLEHDTFHNAYRHGGNRETHDCALVACTCARRTTRTSDLDHIFKAAADMRYEDA